MPRSGRRAGAATPTPDRERLPRRDEMVPVPQRKRPVRRPCSSCKAQQSVKTLIRGLDQKGYFCELCWRDLTEKFASRLRGGETLDRYYKRAYGITLEDYGTRFLSQAGACAICKEQPTDDDPLAVDHDHSTGAVRGLLCRACNIGLGCFKDNAAHMGRAIAYLVESK